MSSSCSDYPQSLRRQGPAGQAVRDREREVGHCSSACSFVPQSPNSCRSGWELTSSTLRRRPCSTARSPRRHRRLTAMSAWQPRQSCAPTHVTIGHAEYRMAQAPAYRPGPGTRMRTVKVKCHAHVPLLLSAACPRSHATRAHAATRGRTRAEEDGAARTERMRTRRFAACFAPQDDYRLLSARTRREAHLLPPEGRFATAFEPLPDISSSLQDCFFSRTNSAGRSLQS